MKKLSLALLAAEGCRESEHSEEGISLCADPPQIRTSEVTRMRPHHSGPSRFAIPSTNETLVDDTSPV